MRLLSLLPLFLLAASIAAASTRKPLTGKFIHLTDLHPDPFYLYGGSEKASCHSEKPRKGSRAGYWGTSVSECDAPLTLINATFDWLAANFKGQIDFVVLTGDNARHDIDLRFPRSLREIYSLNRYIASRIKQTFGNVPVVTSIGNNDIYPHNIMFGGPSAITSQFLKIWHSFIPETNQHTFAGGGYYAVDAIPSSLVLISLNTLYFYDANKAVDGCPAFDELSMLAGIDPGTEELFWLEQQLEIARSRGAQVWLTGHVPPTRLNWYEGCYARYGELMLAYHDTIVGNLFGHMNVDHFTFVDAADIFSPPTRRSGPFHVSKIAEDLREAYEGLQKEANMSDHSIVNVNPSVIPTYLPAVRVWEYNATRDDWRQDVDGAVGWGDDFASSDDDDDGDEDDELSSRSTLLSLLPTSLQLIFSPSLLGRRKKHRKHGKHRKDPPRLPRHFSPSSPACTNRFRTPLGYTQYFLELDKVNLNSGYGPGKEGMKLLKERGEKGVRPTPEWSVEYVTGTAESVARKVLRGEVMGMPESVRQIALQGKESVVSALREAGVVPYEMRDLTVGSWIELGRTLARSDKAWKEFGHRMFVSSGEKGN